MEPLRCFNCNYTGRSHEDFFNISDNHKAFIDRTSESKGSKKELSSLLVCAACVYDRLQRCQGCAKKAPLCMFKMSEWFGDKENRNCIDCAAISEARYICQSGYPLNAIVHQCSVCRHFKYLPSFVTSTKHQPHETLKDCIECQLSRDIDNYKRQAKQRYEFKLQQQPTLPLVEKRITEMTGGETVARAGLSYASVVTSGLSEENSFSELDSLDNSSSVAVIKASDTLLNGSRQLQMGTSFCTTLTDSISSCVLQAMKRSLAELEEKTKLELQLLQSDPELWRIALREKLIRVSQLFSSQATDQVHFNDAESRWAYMSTYTAAHASLMYATVLSGCFEPLTEFLRNGHRQERLHVCCVGAGPGSEILGFHQFLPSNTEWMLLDSCQTWAQTARVLLKDVSGISFRYGPFEIGGRPSDTKGLSLSPSYAFRKAKLFIFSKLVSAVQNLPGAFKSLLDILRHASPGALFLFIDNAHVQTKSFIQDLVFPNRCFTDHKTYKESDSFRLYTTYAELKSDCEEPLKSSVQCECLGLVNHWLDRDPILDLRVNVMLAIKKSSR